MDHETHACGPDGCDVPATQPGTRPGTLPLAAAPSRRPLITGIPPATAASNFSATRAASAAVASS